MAKNTAFDTHAYVKKLTSSGFTEVQAEILAATQIEIIDDRLATKEDITLLHRDMKEMETGLKRDMKEMETNLKRDIKEMEMGITIKLGVLMAGSIAIVATLVKLL